MTPACRQQNGCRGIVTALHTRVRQLWAEYVGAVGLGFAHAWCSLDRTHDRMMKSFSRPWKESTDATSICSYRDCTQPALIVSVTAGKASQGDSTDRAWHSLMLEQ